jgi:hypothetical protein
MSAYTNVSTGFAEAMLKSVAHDVKVARIGSREELQVKTAKLKKRSDTAWLDDSGKALRGGSVGW